LNAAADEATPSNSRAAFMQAMRAIEQANPPGPLAGMLSKDGKVPS
jgi:hypothetical protein